MSGEPVTLGAKIGLTAAILGIVVAAITWNQIVNAPGSGPVRIDREALLVLEHGGLEHGGSGPRRAPPVRPAEQDLPRTDTPPRIPPTEDPPPGRNFRREQSPERGRIYLVKDGDSLYRIATNVWGEPERWPEIAAANGLSDPYWIREGETLQIP